MKLMIVGSWERSTLQEVGSRFASGEHAVPPEPCKVITRWHDPSSRLFWLVVDAPDSKIVQEWMSHWTDIIDWMTHTVLDDQEVGDLLRNVLSS